MAYFSSQDILAKPVENYVYDAGTMSWVKQTQAGGGGGATTIADGDDTAEGSTGDTAWVSGSGTVISILKAIAGFVSGITSLKGALATVNTDELNVNIVTEPAQYYADAGGTIDRLGQIPGGLVVDSSGGNPQLGLVLLYVDNDNALDATIKVAGTNAVLNLVSCYNITDGIGPESTIQPNKWYLVPSTGFHDISLYTTAYGSGTATFYLYGREGQLSLPSASQAVTNTNLDVALSTLLKPADTLAGITTIGAVTAITNTVPVKDVRAATPSQTSVNDSASNVTILASNANRLGATISNDSSAALYLKLGATASTTSYTCKIASGGYYEVPFNYTGIIDGIWATDPNDGAARVTELT